MKKILLVVLCLLTFVTLSNAQDGSNSEQIKTLLVKEDNSDEYYYEEIFPVDRINKDIMFTRAKNWVLANLKTEDNNIQFEEPTSIINSSTILIKGKKYKLGLFGNALVNFKFNIQFKEGKYKLRIDNVIVKSMGVENYPVAAYGPKMVPWKKYNEFLMEEINRAFEGLSISLNKSIKDDNTSAKDDW